MIVFDLKCICGYQFEGWFESRADFDRQNTEGMVSCPLCSGDDIHKILSPVAIHSGACHSENPVSESNNQEIAPETALSFLKSVHDFVEKNFDDVGSRLAEESLKIHYGVVAPRNIRGVTTDEEEKMLSREGIELLKVPMVKKPTDPEIN